MLNSLQRQTPTGIFQLFHIKQEKNALFDQIDNLFQKVSSFYLHIYFEVPHLTSLKMNTPYERTEMHVHVKKRKKWILEIKSIVLVVNCSLFYLE